MEHTESEIFDNLNVQLEYIFNDTIDNIIKEENELTEPLPIS